MTKTLLSKIATLNEDELRRELTEILTRQKLGLVWEHSAIERDRAANQDVVLPRLDAQLSHGLDEGPCQNLISRRGQLRLAETSCAPRTQTKSG